MGDVDWERTFRIALPYLSGPASAVAMHAILSSHGAWVADLGAAFALGLWLAGWRHWYVHRLAPYGADKARAWRVLRGWESAALSSGAYLPNGETRAAVRIRRHTPTPGGMRAELRWPPGLDPTRVDRSCPKLAFALRVSSVRIEVGDEGAFAVIRWAAPNSTVRSSGLGRA